jgi:hypothetical protein
VSPSCAYEVSCRVRAPPNGKTRQRATNPYRVKGGYSPSGPGPEFTPRKARGLTGDGFPAAVPAFLLIGAPGPEWTAFGAVGPEVQVRPRGTATSATIQTSATNCHSIRNRHNGCITTGKVARTDPFPQIAAGAGQPRVPAGRSTESRRPFHPFGAAITRCFTASPASLTSPTTGRCCRPCTVARNPGWVVSAGSGGPESGTNRGRGLFTGAVRGQREDGRQADTAAARAGCGDLLHEQTGGRGDSRGGHGVGPRVGGAPAGL